MDLWWRSELMIGTYVRASKIRNVICHKGCRDRGLLPGNAASIPCMSTMSIRAVESVYMVSQTRGRSKVAGCQSNFRSNRFGRVVSFVLPLSQLLHFCPMPLFDSLACTIFLGHLNPLHATVCHFTLQHDVKFMGTLVSNLCWVVF